MGSVMEKAAHGTFLLLGRSIMLKVLSLGAQVAIFGLARPGDMGIVTIVMATVGIMRFATELGLESALVRSPEYPSPSTIGAVAAWRAVLLTLLAVLPLVSPSTLERVTGISANFAPLFALTLFSFVPDALLISARVHLERSLNFKPFVARDVLNLLGLNTCLILGLLLHKIQIFVFVSSIISNVVMTLVLLPHRQPMRLNLNLNYVRTLAKDMIGFSAGAILQVLRDAISPHIVRTLFGLDVVGYYNFAQRLATPQHMIGEAFWRTTFPAASQMAGNRDELSRLASQSLRYSVLASFILTTILVPALPSLIPLLFPKWTGAIPFVTVYLLFFAVSLPVSSGLAGVNSAAVGSSTFVLDHAIQIMSLWPALWIASHFQAPMSVAWAYGFYMTVTSLGIILMCPPDIRPNLVEYIGRPAFICAIPLIAGLLLSQYLPVALPTKIVLTESVGIVLLCASIWIFARSDVEALRSFITKRKLASAKA